MDKPPFVVLADIYKLVANRGNDMTAIEMEMMLDGIQGIIEYEYNEEDLSNG